MDFKDEEEIIAPDFESIEFEPACKFLYEWSIIPILEPSATVAEISITECLEHKKHLKPLNHSTRIPFLIPSQFCVFTMTTLTHNGIKCT